ncbi:MAG: KH domain-containing protein [Bdellovibrionales bacterium]|nr:KH domain-containing protein [Bdellovibrionales bacterium]
MELREIVEDLIKRLVDEPDEVTITESKGERTTILEARVAKPDMGKVIGRRGKTVEALRVIVGACGAKKKQKCIFQVIDEEEEN